MDDDFEKRQKAMKFVFTLIGIMLLCTFLGIVWEL
tara:strand:+ start:1842 stop:1946 length:105 start_codon:yes stop_codon:yes gene_type:complete